jgi:DNA-binding transcriptional LysR family regulator
VAYRVSLAQATVLDSRSKPQGPLRISAPISLGSNWLTSVLPDFIRAYPDIDIQLILEDDEHDLSTMDIDCALRPHTTVDGDVIERKLGTMSQGLYASDVYLAKYGAPASIEDLDNHRFVAFGDLRPSTLSTANWVLTLGRDEKNPRKPVMEVNNLHGIMRAGEAGVGIVGLPIYMTPLSRRLVRILPHIHGNDFDVYFVYPSELRGSVKAKVFREYLMRATRNWPNNTN